MALSGTPGREMGRGRRNGDDATEVATEVAGFFHESGTGMLPGAKLSLKKPPGMGTLGMAPPRAAERASETMSRSSAFSRSDWFTKVGSCDHLLEAFFRQLEVCDEALAGRGQMGRRGAEAVG